MVEGGVGEHRQDPVGQCMVVVAVVLVKVVVVAVAVVAVVVVLGVDLTHL